MLVCVDYDGVIVDSIDQQLDVVVNTQRIINAGRIPQLQDFHTIENLSPIGFADHIGVPLELRESWCEHIQHNMVNTATETAFFEDALEFLGDISTKHKVIIITSNAREVIERMLGSTPVMGQIHAIYDGAIPGTKDTKIKLAMDKFGYNPSQTYMIGDTRSDIRHGKHAGVKTIAVTWGYQTEETLRLEKPDLVVSNFYQLREILGV